MFKFSKKSLEELAGLDKKLQKVVKDALMVSKVDFSVISGYRTAKEQYEKYQEGLSELDGIHKISSHQCKRAVDLAPYIPGKGVVFELKGYEKEWLELGHAMLKAARMNNAILEWGLAYNINHSYDIGHFELIY